MVRLDQELARERGQTDDSYRRTHRFFIIELAIKDLDNVNVSNSPSDGILPALQGEIGYKA